MTTTDGIDNNAYGAGVRDAKMGLPPFWNAIWSERSSYMLGYNGARMVMANRPSR